MTNNKPRPVYLDRIPPCNNECPLGNNIQGWLQLAKKEDYKGAWEELMNNNPMPSTLGRVCYHPCESGCNRRALDSAVNINAVERFLGDMALEQNWAMPVTAAKTGKKIMVVGAGPAGLSAAFQLCRLGHDVTVYDARNVGGGMMHYGIPSYRLPRDILDGEVKRIENMGVTIKYNTKVEDVMAEKEQGGFDAVFVAVGAPSGRKVNVEHTGAGCEIVDAVDFLDDIEQGNTPNVTGHKVVVYGGGNTAIDAARSAKRLGAKEIEIVYRRNREKMPAHDFEIAEATEEGVTLRLLRTIEAVADKTVTLNTMELNAEGWPEPTGKQETIEADTIIMALGLEVDTEFLRKIEGLAFKKDGCILAEESNMKTSVDGLFAGGDVIPFDRSVATAIGHGKNAARNIDAYLKNQNYTKPQKHELASADKLVTDFYAKSDRKERSQIGFPTRVESFVEVVKGFDKAEAKHECDRCFSCGNCFECDTCFNVCPVKAITKLGEGKGYEIDYDKCIRCGLCARKCPCGAIKMVD